MASMTPRGRCCVRVCVIVCDCCVVVYYVWFGLCCCCSVYMCCRVLHCVIVCVIVCVFVVPGREGFQSRLQRQGEASVRARRTVQSQKDTGVARKKQVANRSWWSHRGNGNKGQTPAGVCVAWTVAGDVTASRAVPDKNRHRLNGYLA